MAPDYRTGPCLKLHDCTTLKAGIAVLRDGIVVINLDSFDYENPRVAAIAGSISNEVQIAKTPKGQSAEIPLSVISAEFAGSGVTAERVAVHLLMRGVEWRSAWRAEVEGNNERSRAQRELTMEEVRRSAQTGTGEIRVRPPE